MKTNLINESLQLVRIALVIVSIILNLILMHLQALHFFSETNATLLR